MEENRLLRVTETAQVLSLGRSKTYAMVKDGIIPSLKIDGRYRVRYGELIAWIRSLEEAA